jgi:hypothetical protein
MSAEFEAYDKMLTAIVEGDYSVEDRMMAEWWREKARKTDRLFTVFHQELINPDADRAAWSESQYVDPNEREDV